MPPSEKESWAVRAEADKERYLHELSTYVPPEGYDAKGDSLVLPDDGGVGCGGWWCGSEQAEDDKKRYDEGIAQYIPPPGHDARENVMAENGAAGPKRRTKRGPNAPKRASGAYVFFTNEMRPIVMEQHPGIKFVDMGRILGERWRALTPEEKTKYEAQSGEDKMRSA